MRIRIFTLLLMLPCIGSAQIDSLSIKEEIQSYKSKIDLIEDGRNLLWDYFKKNDKQKVNDIFLYLLNEEMDGYQTFSAKEKLLIMFYTNNYHLIEDQVRYDYTPRNYEYYDRQVVFARADALHYHLHDDMALKEASIINEIQSSSESEEYKDFLALYFLYISKDRNYYFTRTNDDALNLLSNDFLKKHPNSSYAPYVREKINHLQHLSEWAIDFSFLGGVGLLEGGLHSTFNTISIFGFDVSGSYKRIHLTVKMLAGGTSLKESLLVSDITWYPNTSLSIVAPEISLGYAIINNQRFKFTPYIGLSTMDMSPSTTAIDKREELDGTRLKFATTYNLGGALEIALLTKREMENYDETFHQFIRLRYNYALPQWYKRYEYLTGNLHNITIGYGFFIRSMVRDRNNHF